MKQQTTAAEAAHEVFPDAKVASDAPPTLAQKLVKIMGAIGTVEKRGRNDFHKYDYATEADVSRAVRAAFIAERVLLVPSMKSIATRGEGKGCITQVVMTYRLIDADSGESLEYDMPGEGQDGGDKGPYKAVTGSEKYALMKLLLIPTGDDPEKDDTDTDAKADAKEPAKDRREERRDEPEGDPDPPVSTRPATGVAASRNRSANPCTPGQVKLLYARLKNANVRKEALCEKFGIEKVDEMPFASVNDALAWIGQGEN